MSNTRRLCLILVSGSLGLLGACGGDDDGPCNVQEQTGCDDGLVCEVVQDGEPTCFAPVVVRGEVIDLIAGSPVAGANVVALDINGAAVSSVAVSDEAGAYELRIPSTRSADGIPVAIEMTLRADATGYQTFPSGLRQSLPIDTGIAVDLEGTYVVESALTDIGLFALEGGFGTGAVYGSVELPADRTGVLVVATDASGVGYSSVANIDGDYRIFNLPDGTYTVQAYARGINYQSAEAIIEATETEVDLALDSAPAGSVSGTLSFVNPGSGLTSVVLVVESTFNESLQRGATVPGLRAPEPGIAPNVEGAYLIEGVPSGRYVVLAAFENDDFVRDPDLSIGGTSILHIDVIAGQTTTVDSFKVTGALSIVGPGATAAEAVTEPVTLSWIDDSSEDEYVVEVFDAFGNVAWTTTLAGYSGEDPAIPYGGEALVPGMYYQLRVTSKKDGVPISRTEDLKGVFYLP